MDNASRSPTLDGRTLPRRFHGSKFGFGVDLMRSGCSSSQRRDPTPPTNSSYLVEALIIGVVHLKTSSRFGWAQAMAAQVPHCSLSLSL
jgi:hypothetical protein